MLNKQTIEKLFEMKLDGMAAAFKEQLTQPDVADLSFEERPRWWSTGNIPSVKRSAW